MRKLTPATVLVATALLMLATACSDDSKQAEAAAEASTATEIVAVTYEGEGSIMDQPVDFSSAENVEISLETIRKYAGDKEANSIRNAMEYMLFYDLGLGKDKAKLYKKLNGKTPNEILASTGR